MNELKFDELQEVNGGFAITIGAMTITGAAIAKGAVAVGTVYSAGYVLGQNTKKAKKNKY